MEGSSIADMIVERQEDHVFKVDKRVYLDADILARERREIFDRCWLYACHESELAQPGDFIARKVGGRPLIFTRNDDGGVQAFFNACPHRGNLVCREKRGNAKRFTCFYHAWTFGLDGRLVGLPGADSYSAAFRKEEMGLVPVPRLDSYRGLVFVNYDPNAIDLGDYLGEARQYLDFNLDFTGTDLEVVRGNQAYDVRANWKMQIENTLDGYHFGITHNRFITQYLKSVGLDRSTSIPKGRSISLGNGHLVNEMPRAPTALSGTADKELMEIRQRLEREVGPDRAARILDFSRVIFIFPNLLSISSWRALRTVYPMGPDHSEVDAFGLMPRGEDPAIREKRLNDFISFQGPGGFGTPDDVSVLEGCQEGLAGLMEGWVDNSRGMDRAEPELGDEQQMRIFWRRWRVLMGGAPAPADYADHAEIRDAAE